MNVFISGSREITKLDNNVLNALFIELNSDVNILVGDAEGVDAEIQKFCKDHYYKNVTVYAINGRARNNLGNFDVKNITVDRKTYFKTSFTEKDKAMTDIADYGIVIWDGKSKGSFNNILRLIRQNKPCHVYLANYKKWVLMDSENIDEIGRLKNMKVLDNTVVQLSFL